MKRSEDLVKKRRTFIDDYMYKNYDKSIKYNVLTLSNDILFISPSTVWKDIYVLKHIKNPWTKI